MRRALFWALLFCPVQGYASPGLNNSELTYQAACLAAELPSDQLVQACHAALQDPRITDQERPRFLIALASAQNNADDFQGALESAQEALSMSPDNVGAMLELAWSHYYLDQYQEAFPLFEKVVLVSPSGSAYSGLGTTLIRLRPEESATAIAHLRTSLLLNPQSAWTHAELGWSLRRTGQLEASNASFEKALEIHPEYSYALYWLASNNNELGNYEKALEWANADLQLGESYWSQLQRGLALMNLGRNVQALREFTAAVELNPEEESAYVNRARALEAMGLRGAAIEALENVPEDVERSDFFYYWQAVYLADDNQVASAEAAAAKAVLFNETDYLNWQVQAYVLIEAENFEKALHSAETALKHQTVADPWTDLYIAVAKIHLGEVAPGLESYRKTIGTDLTEPAINWFFAHLVKLNLLAEAEQLRQEM